MFYMNERIEGGDYMIGSNIRRIRKDKIPSKIKNLKYFIKMC